MISDRPRYVKRRNRMKIIPHASQRRLTVDVSDLAGLALGIALSAWSCLVSRRDESMFSLPPVTGVLLLA